MHTKKNYVRYVSGKAYRSFVHRVVIIAKYTTTRYVRAVDWCVDGTHFAHIYYVQRIGHISWQRSLLIFIINILIWLSGNKWTALHSYNRLRIWLPWELSCFRWCFWAAIRSNDISCNIRRTDRTVRHCGRCVDDERKTCCVVRVRYEFTMTISYVHGRFKRTLASDSV